MRHDPLAPRQRVNLLIERETVAEARALGFNLSQTANRALRAAIKEERERRWREENGAAFESANAWFEERGIPYADLRVR